MILGIARDWPWWKSGLVVVYALGYWIYLIAAGVTSWPRLPWFDWTAYMGWQLLYALIWPVWLVL